MKMEKNVLNSKKKTTKIKFKKKIAIELREKCKHKLQNTDIITAMSMLISPNSWLWQKMAKDTCLANDS